MKLKNLNKLMTILGSIRQIRNKFLQSALEQTTNGVAVLKKKRRKTYERALCDNLGSIALV